MAAVYIHIPFCAQRCVYCDFYFVTANKGHTGYVNALCTEVESCPYDDAIETIYVGGGTPSRLEIGHIGRILAAVYNRFECSRLREVTVELNPEDSDDEYLSGLRALGVNRLSLGIQSFFEDDLRFMNRSHGPEEAMSALHAIRDAGFDNFTVDLIFGLPGQSIRQWDENLKRVVHFQVPHVSTYGLTIEKRTPLYKRVALGLVKPESEDIMADKFLSAMVYLHGEGYEHYEISSFARPGFRSAHNQLYWNHVDYLGFGPSAHSFRWNAGGARRWSNVRSLRKYLRCIEHGESPVAEKEALSPRALALERIMLSIRTNDGLDLNLLRSRYGMDLASEKHIDLSALESKGFVEWVNPDRLRLTDRGRLVCDAVTARIA